MDCVFRSGMPQVKRLTQHRLIQGGAPICAPDRHSTTPTGKPAGLRPKTGHARRAISGKQPSQPAFVLHKWPFWAALVIFNLAGNAFGQKSNLPQEVLPTLTTANAAHSLQHAEAMRGYPVRLRAVVSYYDPYTDPRLGAFFACDSTGCICVLVPPRPILPIQTGTLVDVSGVTDPGNYAPVVIGTKVQAIGQSHLPAKLPRRSLAQLLTGADDGQWVEVEGVVHSVAQSGRHVTLTLALKDGMIRGVTQLEEGADYARLVDSEIVLHANAAPIWTKNRQMVGARLLFPSLAQIRIEKPSPADPLSMPIRPISSLLRFAPDVTSVHRVRVRGRVTLQWPGQLFIQDGSQGLLISTFQETPLKLGDTVDSAGFPAMGEYNLMLEDAIFKPVAGGPDVAAAPVTPQEVMKGDHDAKLIKIRGRLVNQDLTTEHPTLVISSGGMLFPAVFPIGAKTGKIGSWRVGSELQLTGVCSVQVDKYLSVEREGGALPRSFRVLLRSPQDVVVEREPSWWTASRILVLLVISMLTILLGTLWVAGLKKNVRELKRAQAQLVLARDASEAANRAKGVFLATMSHELRTPLNAIIGYSQMLKEDCIGPEQEEVQHDLEKIERSGNMLLSVINDILDLSKIEYGRETLNAQTFDLAPVLQDVSKAVQGLARQQGNVLEIDCPEKTHTAYADLPKFRLCVLNLVNNALKFTENGHVSVTVNKLCNGHGVWTEVHVIDTGIGISKQDLGKLFQPFSQVDGSSTRRYGGTGLGLAISKEYCQMMGGDITVVSEPERGSRFSIRVPAGQSRTAPELQPVEMAV